MAAPQSTQVEMQDAQSDATAPPLDQAKQSLLSTLTMFEQFAQQNTEAQHRISEQQKEIESLRKSLAAEHGHHVHWQAQYALQMVQISTMRKEREQLLQSNKYVVEAAEKVADMGSNAGLVDLTAGMEELQKAVRTRDEGGKAEEHGKAVTEARKRKRGALKMRMSGAAVVQGATASADESLIRNAATGSQASSARPKLLLKMHVT